MSMHRYLISEIEKLYPADSQYPDIAYTGTKLLDLSLHEHGLTLSSPKYWRNCLNEVLKTYLDKCKEFSANAENELFEFLEQNEDLTEKFPV